MIRGVPYDHQLEYSQGAAAASAVDIGVQLASVGRICFRYSFVDVGASVTVDDAFQSRLDGLGGDCYVIFNTRTRRLLQSLRGPGGASYALGTITQQTWFDVTMDCDADSATINGVTYSATSHSEIYDQDRIYLHAGFHASRGKMYYFKTWDLNGNPQRDMVPVSDGNGRVYWYDRITRRAFFPTKAELVAGPVASTPLMGVHMYPTANLWKWPTQATTGSAGPTTVWTPVLDVVYPRVASNGYVNSGYYDPFIAGPNTIYSLYNTGYCAAVFRKLPPGNYKISANISKYSSTYTTAAITVMDYAPSAGQWVLSGNKSSGFKPFGTISMTFTVEPGHLVAVQFSSGQTNASILVKDVSITEVLS